MTRTPRRRPAADRLPEGVQLPAPRVTLKMAPGARPLPVMTEDQLATKTARHLHGMFPGANPRTVVKARKAMGGRPATRATYEPTHPWASWWHTPNEGKRSLGGGQAAVNMGLRAGVYDLAFLFDLGEAKVWRPALGKGEGRGRHETVRLVQPAFIELKRPDGGEGRSDAQILFGGHAEALGVWTAECWSVEEVDATLRHWLAPWGRIPRTVPMVGYG